MTDIEALIAEGLTAQTEGWDFSRFGDRMVVTPPDWDYAAMAATVADDATGPLLDMGTGGGEWLAEWLAVRPRRPGLVVATEGWPPNVAVARTRLAPLDVAVVPVRGATDNVDQDSQDRSGPLPFAPAAFGRILNRHESYRPSEVARVLRPGGVFLTQQVGSDGERELRELFGLAPVEAVDWTLRFAVDQAAAGGLTVVDGGVGTDVTTYRDVAPLIWYLRQVPWSLPEVDPATDTDRFRAVQSRIELRGPVRVRRPYFWFRAIRRPD